MKQTEQQAIDEANYRYRLYIEDLQEAQLSVKKQQQANEIWQERFFRLQQQEQTLYQESIASAEPEERAFFEMRTDENRQLSRNALRELEAEAEELAQERRGLLEKEEQIHQEQQAFLTPKKEDASYGT